jgi:hypothetical protein
MGLEPVVAAAQAAQVRAVGRSAVGVGVHVVQVGARSRSAAAGMTARAVAGAQEPALGGCRAVAVDRRWPVQHRATALNAWVIGAAAAYQPLQLRSTDRRAQGAGDRIDQRDVQRPTARSVQPTGAQRVQLFEQVAQLFVSDRRPVDRRDVLVGRRPRRRRGAVVVCSGRREQRPRTHPPEHHGQRRDQLQVRGHRLATRVPRPQDQVTQGQRTQLPDRPLVAVVLRHPRVEVDGLPARGSDRRRQVRDQLRHAVTDRPHPHIGRPLRLLPPPVGSRRVDGDQRRGGALPQPCRGLPRARPLQRLRLDLGHDRGLHRTTR